MAGDDVEAVDEDATEEVAVLAVAGEEGSALPEPVDDEVKAEAEMDELLLDDELEELDDEGIEDERCDDWDGFAKAHCEVPTSSCQSRIRIG